MIRIDSGVRSTSAREVTISATYRPAPCSRHSRRNARLVTPAIGASTTGVSTTIGPIRSGGRTARPTGTGPGVGACCAMRGAAVTWSSSPIALEPLATASSDTSTDAVVIIGTSRRSRDEDFTAFVADHQADLLRTAWLLCGDSHRAEELTQQALVRTGARPGAVGAGDPVAYARRRRA